MSEFDDDYDDVLIDAYEQYLDNDSQLDFVTPAIISKKRDRSQSASGDEIPKVVSFKTTAEDRVSKPRCRPKAIVEVIDDIHVKSMTGLPAKKK